MTKKSRAELSVVARILEPPEPAESLPEDARAVWREVFRACRADQFNGCLFLVESYARTVALERRFAAELELTPPGETRDELARALRAQTSLAASLAGKLRLSPKSRRDPTAKLHTVPPGIERPWKIPVRDEPSEAS